MSGLHELFTRYPKAVFGVALQECYDERRPVYAIEEYEEYVDDGANVFTVYCLICYSKQALFQFDPDEFYSDAKYYGHCFEHNGRRLRHCGSDECQTLSEFYHDKEQGKHRQASFIATYGAKIRRAPDDVRLTAMTAHMLKLTSKERISNG